MMGWGGAGVALAACDQPSYVTLEEGKEEVVSYLQPEEYVIPGVGVYYASTCTACAASCGVHGRVREGRVLKLEGNPKSPINNGRLCQMGQAALQAHYNPDRLYKPLMRKGGSLQEVSWEEAMQAINQKVGASAVTPGEKIAWFTDTVSGHQAVLIDAYLAAVGARSHYVYATINNAVSRAVGLEMLGEAQPAYDISKAKTILSFGADLLGASASPVHFAVEYAKFRTAMPRGVLIQIEPSMSLTGANADLWQPVRPGTEVALALGIAHELVVKHGLSTQGVPETLLSTMREFTAEKVAQVTGAAPERVAQIARVLKERSPSLVLSGASAEAQTNGYQMAAAAMMLNILLGNVGQTIVSRGTTPFPQLEAKVGSSKALMDFAAAADKSAYEVAFFYNTNPVYAAPKTLALEEKLKKIPFKIALTHFRDETAMQADVVLPLASAMEDWATHVAPYQPPGKRVISIQQPLMEPLQATTKGFGDIMLALLKARNPQEYSGFTDYYAYLKSAFAALPAVHKQGATNEESFWNQMLQEGVLTIAAGPGALAPKMIDFGPITLPTTPPAGGYRLAPAARLALWDGRHANLPWLQEAPDQITKVVWSTPVEMHPQTASALGVVEGDFVKVTAPGGVVEGQVYIYRGIHPSVIAVAMGRGHEEYGRYAKGQTGNSLKLLDLTQEAKTGELALYGTTVNVTKTDRREVLVKLMGNETQLGRKMVRTVRAEEFERTEGSKNVA